MRIKSPPELADQTVEERLITFDWDKNFHTFQEATRKGAFRPLCWGKTQALIDVSRPLSIKKDLLSALFLLYIFLTGNAFLFVFRDQRRRITLLRTSPSRRRATATRPCVCRGARCRRGRPALPSRRTARPSCRKRRLNATAARRRTRRGRRRERARRQRRRRRRRRASRRGSSGAKASR